MKPLLINFLLVLGLSIISNPLLSQINLYWSTGSSTTSARVHKCLNDGTHYSECFGSIHDITDIAIDHTSIPKRIYYTERGEQRICSSELDGTNVSAVVTNTPGVYSLTLDLENRKVFYCTDTYASDKILKADMDGTDQNVEQFFEFTTTMVKTRGLCLDAENDKLYWIRAGSICNDKIIRCNYDGSGYEVVANNNTPNLTMISPNDLAVGNGYLFWTEPSEDKIYRINTDKSGLTNILDVKAYQIDIDTSNGKIYFIMKTHMGVYHIHSSSYDGTGFEDKVTLTSSLPMGLCADSSGGTTNVGTNSENNFQLYPNPIQGGQLLFTPKYLGIETVIFYDISGQIVSTYKIDKQNNIAIDLPKGIYLCRMDGINTITQKMIVK